MKCCHCGAELDECRSLAVSGLWYSEHLDKWLLTGNYICPETRMFCTPRCLIDWSEQRLVPCVE